jgi:hypothetical protein
VINEDTILADLATRSEAELLSIRDQAREVVYGHTTSISGLSQSAQWDKQSADMVLRLANQVIAGRQSGAAGASDPVTSRGLLGHSVRFGSRVISAP